MSEWDRIADGMHDGWINQWKVVYPKDTLQIRDSLILNEFRGDKGGRSERDGEVCKIHLLVLQRLEWARDYQGHQWGTW